MVNDLHTRLIIALGASLKGMKSLPRGRLPQGKGISIAVHPSLSSSTFRPCLDVATKASNAICFVRPGHYNICFIIHQQNIFGPQSLSMRCAIISDIHSNLEALNAVLEKIDNTGVDQIVSLGDAVGYNANPNECVRILRERSIPTLIGNHDAVAASLEEPDDFNFVARKAVLWTRAALDTENSLFLRQQPESRPLIDGVKLVHGSLLHRDHYIMSRFDRQENLYRMHTATPPIHLLFFGHTHHQCAFVAMDNEIRPVGQKKFQLKQGASFIVNPGSVGQPRDRDPRAAFLIYDDEAGSIEFFRAPYDLDACTQKILSAGLPPELAERLYQGW